MEVELNAPGTEQRYLNALNLCFNGWGGAEEFGWYFQRPFAGRVADRFMLLEEGEAIAGSAVSWRELLDANGRERRIGIMTGSWTLPAARGRGCFTRIIEISRQLCVDCGADWLLAFVTHDNPSRRALEKAGSTMIRTSYLSSPDAPAAQPGSGLAREVEADDRRLAQLWQARRSAAARQMRFHYRTPELWRQQLIGRTLPVELLESEAGGAAVVERHPVFDRLLSASAAGGEERLRIEEAVCRRAIGAGRRYFSFSSDAAYAASLRDRCGLEAKEGFITLLSAAEEAPPSSGPWFVEGGDRL